MTNRKSVSVIPEVNLNNSKRFRKSRFLWHSLTYYITRGNSAIPEVIYRKIRKSKKIREVVFSLAFSDLLHQSFFKPRAPPERRLAKAAYLSHHAIFVIIVIVVVIGIDAI